MVNMRNLPITQQCRKRPFVSGGSTITYKDPSLFITETYNVLKTWFNYSSILFFWNQSRELKINVEFLVRTYMRITKAFRTSRRFGNTDTQISSTFHKVIEFNLGQIKYTINILMNIFKSMFSTMNEALIPKKIMSIVRQRLEVAGLVPHRWNGSLWNLGIIF